MRTDVTNDRAPLTTEIAFLRDILDTCGLSDNDRDLLATTVAVLSGIQPHLRDAMTAAE
ncbi:MAG TPA: hypothetical protein VEB64_07585 [Azospirillaceae bacterium]|nr:hypothetical protein [Azospirillaceae bacterium]